MKRDAGPTLGILQAVFASLILAGCGGGDPTVPTVTVEPVEMDFEVFARGELIASESLPIALPASIRMGFNISWLAPEFSEIRAGEVIARFDDVQVRLDQESTALKLAKSDYQLVNTQRVGEVELTRLAHETERVGGERIITESFADLDEGLFSRNEIIDALSDLDYLDVEATFLNWQSATFDQRTQAEQNMIQAMREGEASKLQKQDLALGMMELRSPADGTFVYASTSWGEKLGKGKTVFPGMPIGLLPIRGKVAARLFVPETDAVGLAQGQSVRFRLDSAATRQFTARVESVSPVASPRSRSNPQKFFSVEAVIDDIDADLMRVGSRLRAHIITATVKDAIVVPAQAVYGDANNAHVFVVDGQTSVRREVQLGRRSPNLVELVEGVNPGEKISLVAPAEQS